jgi:hypothetical protein
MSNLKQLGFAVLQFEGPQGKFPFCSDAAQYDASFNVTGYYPLANSTRPQAASQNSGYSWLVQILPYIEETILYGQLGQASQRLKLRPFNTTTQITFPGSTIHISSRAVPSFKCPSSGILTNSEGQEYLQYNCAATNYMAIPGTSLQTTSTDVVPNGVLTQRSAITQNGVKMGEIQSGDGTSKTVIICESREKRYNAWMDGSAAWVIGFKTNACGTGCTPVTGEVKDGVVNGTGIQVANDRTTQCQDPRSHALNFGPPLPMGATDYLTAGGQGPGASANREWGPSSEHTGSIIIHCFADDHCKAIPETIDASVYFHMITRRGGDSVVIPGE